MNRPTCWAHPHRELIVIVCPHCDEGWINHPNDDDEDSDDTCWEELCLACDGEGITYICPDHGKVDPLW